MQRKNKVEIEKVKISLSESEKQTVLKTGFLEPPKLLKLRSKLYRIPVVKKLIGSFDVIKYYDQKSQTAQDSMRKIVEDRKDAQKLEAGMGYSEFDEIGSVLQYIKETRDLEACKHLPSYHFSKLTLENISEILDRDDQAKGSFDFGISYAYNASLLAKKYPQKTFSGIDRSHYTKAINEADFGDIPNLSFQCGDVLKHLAETKYDDNIFFHARTLCSLSKSFISDLFSHVKQANFKYIVGLEVVGVSIFTGESYPYSYEEQKSSVYRDELYLHNYPELLKKAGYELTKFEHYQIPGFRKDYRILVYQAERK